MALHNALTAANLHKTYPWSYANSAARTGATGMASGDIGHLALQVDDYSLWVLTATTPTTWKRVDYDSAHVHSNATTSVAGFMSAADKTKMDGIEAGATADQTGNEILTALLTVDGTGCGLDADKLDGNEASAFATSGHTHSYLPLSGGTITGSLQVIPPSTLYSSTSNYNIGGPSAPMGLLYSHGSYRTSLMSNGYRNSSDTWTSFEVNGHTGASGIELDPNGYIYIYADTSKASGDSYTIDRVVSITPNCFMIGAAAPSSNVKLYVGSVRTGSTSTYQIYAAGEIQSDVTAGTYSYHSVPSIAADAAVGTICHYNCSQGTYSGTVGSQYGYLAQSTLISGATNNIGFYGQIPSTAPGAYNLYMSGTASNYLLGNTGIGGLPDSTHKLKLTGSQIIYNSATPSASITDDTVLYAADIAAGHRALHVRNENDTVIKLYQQALVASPSADSASLKTAVDAIRALLINNGLMAAA